MDWEVLSSRNIDILQKKISCFGKAQLALRSHFTKNDTVAIPQSDVCGPTSEQVTKLRPKNTSL
jgi:hypothetical protein